MGGVSGLHIQVTPSGARSWILRVKIGEKRRDMGMGGFPDVSLAQARERAREARDKIAKGVDPIAAKQADRTAIVSEQARAKTFGECTASYIAAKEAEWTNPKHRAQWLNTLETYAHPTIGKMLVRDVDQEHIMAILQPIWATKTETATRVRQRMEAVLDWAKTSKFRTGDNPARWRGHLDKLLAKPSKVTKVEHHAALDMNAIQGFLTAVGKDKGMGARALEFAIYTAARSGEVRGAVWDEFDMDAGVWTIPAVRMKAGREHRVPLSDAALKLLKALPRMDGSEFVFHAVRGGMLSDMTLSAVMRRMNVDAVPHGFRSTFRDWAAERTAYPSEVVEMALAHTIENKVEAAYRRGDLFEKRTRLMADWSKFCHTPPIDGKVVPLKLKQA